MMLFFHSFIVIILITVFICFVILIVLFLLINLNCLLPNCFILVTIISFLLIGWVFLLFKCFLMFFIELIGDCKCFLLLIVYVFLLILRIVFLINFQDCNLQIGNLFLLFFLLLNLNWHSNCSYWDYYYSYNH